MSIDPTGRPLLDLYFTKLRNFKMQRSLRMLAVVVAATLTTNAITPLAFASKGERRLRSLSLGEATRLVEELPSSPDFPLVMNADVLAMLNSYLTDPGRVQHLKDSLDRMNDYRPMIEAKIKKSGLPPELVVVPFIESGYRNFGSADGDVSDVPNRRRGAGLWMVIKNTGRLLGLKINSKIDQRLDPSTETDAALRLLKRHHREFHKNWFLALAAYQQGSGSVKEQIESSDHHDPWRLVAEKKLTDYIPRAMAMLIVIKKPELLKAPRRPHARASLPYK